MQPAGPVLERLLAELRQPLQTLVSLADLLDLKMAALDGSVRQQTDGFRDTVRQVDWLVAEAAFHVSRPAFQPEVMNLRTLVEGCVTRLSRQTRSSLGLEEVTGQSCMLYGDAMLLERFVANAVRLADQLGEPGRRISMRLGQEPLHGFPALYLDLEASIPHVHAGDFTAGELRDEAGPLRGFSFVLENCRWILEAHHAAVEFADLPGPLLRLRVFFPLLSPEQAGALGRA